MAGNAEEAGGGETGADDGANDNGDDVPPAPPEVLDCEARWLDNPDPRVRVDAELDCVAAGFANFGFSVASIPDAAFAVVSGSTREWVIRVASDAIEPVLGGPQGMQWQRVVSTINAEGNLVLAGDVGRGSARVFEVWELAEQWRRLGEAEIRAVDNVSDLDASANGAVAAWVEIDDERSVLSNGNDWLLQPAVALDRSVVAGHVLVDDVETAVGSTPRGEKGTAALRSRAANADIVQLGSDLPAPIEVLLPVRARARVFAEEEPSVAALAGTQDELRLAWEGGTVSVSSAAMASPACPNRAGGEDIEESEDCGPCSEEGVGRFGQAVSVARADDGTFLIAYVHGDITRHFQYRFQCTNPDGASCWCDTEFWDGGSSFELRLVAVRKDGSQETILATPLEGTPGAWDGASPGILIDADAQGGQVAIAAKLGDAPMRVLIVDAVDGSALGG